MNDKLRMPINLRISLKERRDLLKFKRDEILHRIQEMEDIIQGISDDVQSRLIVVRARSYWIPGVRSMLEEGGRGSVIPFDDTIREIEDEIPPPGDCQEDLSGSGVKGFQRKKDPGDLS